METGYNRHYKAICASVIFMAISSIGNAYAESYNLALNTENCVASKWTDSAGNSISIEEKFGPGTMALTRCLEKTRKVKALFQINQECKNAACDAPYAVGNINNQITDYVVTHGMDSGDYDVVVIVHSAGWKLILDNNATDKHTANNPFQAATEDLVTNPNVKVLFCQNTAASKNVVLANMINGIGFVTAGVSALTDLQNSGYKYIQP